MEGQPICSPLPVHKSNNMMARSNFRLLASGLFVVAASVSLAGGKAQARPSDEAMSGAYQCAAISGSRQWLDCYYGAAQPVRAALGLPPAPAAQIGLVHAPAAAAQGPAADPGVRHAVMRAAADCDGLADERSWLACYYAAAQPMRVVLHLSPAPQVPIVGAPRPAAAPRNPVAAPAEPGPVTARMQDYRFDKFGYFTVTLSDGQVWRQVDGDTLFAHWKKPAAGYQVRVTQGFMTSFNLQVRGLPGLYKVQRVS
jgi:hypothetical protein